MRIIALSDVHGNLPALQAVLAAIEGTPDMVIVAGDSVGFGPRSPEVLELLRSQDCRLVKGNVDDYVANPSSIERLYQFADQEVSSGRPFRPLLPLPAIAESTRWTRSQLSEQQLDFLNRLPFSISVEPVPGRRLKVVHANPHDLERPIVQKSPDAELLPMLSGLDIDILLFGHSHNPFQRMMGNTLLLDVASLGFPTDGCSDAPYAEITFSEGEWHVGLHRVAYDTEATVSLIEASSMPNKDMVLALLRTARRVRDG